ESWEPNRESVLSAGVTDQQSNQQPKILVLQPRSVGSDVARHIGITAFFRFQSCDEGNIFSSSASQLASSGRSLTRGSQTAMSASEMQPKSPNSQRHRTLFTTR